jgi:hypothetical protein
MLRLLVAAGWAASVRGQSLASTVDDWIELNGQAAGWAQVRGGAMTTTVQPADRGPAGVPLPQQFRHSAPSDLEIRFGPGLHRPFYAWMGTCLESGAPAPAALAAFGFGPLPLHRLWTNAYVTGLTVPALAVGNQEEAQLAATVHPVAAQNAGLVPAPPPGTPTPWRRSQFRFQIPGLLELSDGITAIAELRFRRPLAGDGLGAPSHGLLSLTLPPDTHRALASILVRPPRRSGNLDLFTRNGGIWLRLTFHRLRPAFRLEPGAAASPLALEFDSAAVAAG